MPGRLGWQEDAAICVEMPLAEAYAKFPRRGLVGSLPPLALALQGKVNPKTIESLRELGYDLASIVLKDIQDF